MTLVRVSELGRFHLVGFVFAQNNILCSHWMVSDLEETLWLGIGDIVIVSTIDRVPLIAWLKHCTKGGFG